MNSPSLVPSAPYSIFSPIFVATAAVASGALGKIADWNIIREISGIIWEGRLSIWTIFPNIMKERLEGLILERKVRLAFCVYTFYGIFKYNYYSIE